MIDVLICLVAMDCCFILKMIGDDATDCRKQ